MPAKSPSAPLRAQLRQRILNRIVELKLRDAAAAEQLGLSAGQIDRPSPGRGQGAPRPADRRRRAHRHQRAHQRDATVRRKAERRGEAAGTRAQIEVGNVIFLAGRSRCAFQLSVPTLPRTSAPRGPFPLSSP